MYLGELDELGGALDASHVHNGRVVGALADPIVEAVPEGGTQLDSFLVGAERGTFVDTIHLLVSPVADGILPNLHTPNAP